eukprot:2049055-Amphidinium_carterae.1
MVRSILRLTQKAQGSVVDRSRQCASVRRATTQSPTSQVLGNPKQAGHFTNRSVQSCPAQDGVVPCSATGHTVLEALESCACKRPLLRASNHAARSWHASVHPAACVHAPPRVR